MIETARRLPMLLILILVSCLLALTVYTSEPLLREVEAHLEEHVHQDFLAKYKRESPPTTNDPDCPDADAYFYATSHNYTWQIQCATTYDGDIITTSNAANFSACIVLCAQSNRAGVAAFCHGVNFNGPADDGSGSCTLYSMVADVNLADEEGLVQSAALLIYGPTGQQYAIPEAAPIAPDAPGNAASAGPTTTSTTAITSLTVVTSCGPEITNCPAHSASAAAPPPPPPSPPPTSVTHVVPSFSLTIDGPRTQTPIPLQPTTSASHPPPLTPSVIGTSTGPGGQVTYTELVPTVQVRISLLIMCEETPTSSCSTSTGPAQRIPGMRTEVSCSPAPCTGVKVATGAFASMASADTCVASFW